uniref:Nucleoprotein n=1 Tax=Chum salmon influenza-like virus TaxID=2777032 RepID=A0A866VZ25_9ORTO|nr:nucleoprotein [Chum salmon influenza-like virus]
MTSTVMDVDMANGSTEDEKRKLYEQLKYKPMIPGEERPTDEAGGRAYDKGLLKWNESKASMFHMEVMTDMEKGKYPILTQKDKDAINSRNSRVYKGFEYEVKRLEQEESQRPPATLAPGTSATKPSLSAPSKATSKTNFTSKRKMGRDDDRTGGKFQKDNAAGRQSIADIKASVCSMIKSLGGFYVMMCVAFGLDAPAEKNLLQNSMAIERMILSATDERRTEYLREMIKSGKTAKEGMENMDVDKTGGTLYKYENGMFVPFKVSVQKSQIMDAWKTAFNGGPGYNGLTHIMIWHSNMNDTCFQRSMALKSGGLDPSMISLFSGSTLPRRAGTSGRACRGAGTLIAEINRFIGRSRNDKSTFRSTERRNAYHKLLDALEEKAAAPVQKELVRMVKSATNPGAEEQEDLTLLARSMIVVRPGMSHKVALPLCIYAQAFEKDIEVHSMIGIEAQRMFAECKIMTLVRDYNGRPENMADKSQLFYMSCLGLAYEDLNLLSFMCGTTLKPRSALKCKPFMVPVAEQQPKMKAMVFSCKPNMWAPMARSGGNEASDGAGGTGQIGVQPAFTVERVIPVDKEAMRKFSETANGNSGRSMDIRKDIRDLMIKASSKDTVGFKGKQLFRFNDPECKEGFEFTGGNQHQSFFFGRDNSEEYKEGN